jgi:integrase
MNEATCHVSIPKPIANCLRLSRHTIRLRFLTACKCLGRERLATLTIHHGRHTFISHALAGGRTLPEVRLAAGHSNIVTTSVYVHVAVDEDEAVGRLFAVAGDVSTR